MVLFASRLLLVLLQFHLCKPGWRYGNQEGSSFTDTFIGVNDNLRLGGSQPQYL